MVRRLVGTIVGALIGAFLGAGTGIVGAFGGISGLIVFALIGGTIGFLATPNISKLGSRVARLCRKDENQCRHSLCFLACH